MIYDRPPSFSELPLPGNGPLLAPVAADCAPPAMQWKLWIYTNFDCNLRCSYCVAKSSPNAPRRALGLANVQRLVDEAVALGFSEIFFTGGEPFVLNDIYDMLSFSAARVKTTVLTNAMILRGSRLQRLSAIAHENLHVQVSLDGATADDHDAYRGKGSWEKTLEGIRLLQECGFRVRLSTTETPVSMSGRSTTRLTSTPALATASSWMRPSASSPTAAISPVSIPSRAAPQAVIEPEPPIVRLDSSTRVST